MKSRRSIDFSATSADDLTSALRLFEGADADWSDEDLAFMWRHQLDANLAEEVSELMSTGIGPLLNGLKPPVATFRDLLWHACPPVRLLRIGKEFAKVSANHPHRPLPRDLARMLYLLFIVVARRHGESISSKSAENLSDDLEWARRQPWIDDATKVLLKA